MKSANYQVQPSAKGDLREISNYISKDSPINATKFVKQLFQTIRNIAATPGRGKLISSNHLPTGARRARHGNYYIYYSQAKAEVQILRVINRYRNQARALSPGRSELGTDRDKMEQTAAQERKREHSVMRQKARSQVKREQDFDRGL